MNAQAPKNVVLKFDEERILRQLQRDDSVLEHYRAVALARALPEIILIWVRNGTKETPEEMAEMMLEIFYIKHHASELPFSNDIESITKI